MFEKEIGKFIQLTVDFLNDYRDTEGQKAEIRKKMRELELEKKKNNEAKKEKSLELEQRNIEIIENKKNLPEKINESQQKVLAIDEELKATGNILSILEELSSKKSNKESVFFLNNQILKRSLNPHYSKSEVKYLKNLKKLFIENLNEEKLALESEASQSVLKKYNIQWNDKEYSQNDFLELCKALIESKAIIGSQKDFINGFAELVNIKIKAQDRQIQSMKNSRNADTQTKFLDKLKVSLNLWIDKMKN